ncbi:MAG: hypothetical protein KY391_03895 [Actinobacteria bacterium]|nr:hypothetical protein [Actinomycetota bacterium]
MSGRIWTKLGLAVVVAAVAIAPAGAATKQMDATDDPEMSGELELASENCQTKNVRHDGSIIAKGKTCLRIYSYDPGAETDTERNYGVAWLQSNVNSRLGWCAARVVSDIDLPEGFEVEARAPRAMDLKRRKVYETALAPNAGGNAMETAEETSIKQTQVLYPRLLRMRILAETNIVRLKWRGLRNEKLGFASGAEVSWSSDAEPDPVSYRLNYRLQRGDC